MPIPSQTHKHAFTTKLCWVVQAHAIAQHRFVVKALGYYYVLNQFATKITRLGLVLEFGARGNIEAFVASNGVIISLISFFSALISNFQRKLGAVKSPQLLLWARDLIEALSFLHNDRCIVHGDIK